MLLGHHLVSTSLISLDKRQVLSPHYPYRVSVDACITPKTSASYCLFHCAQFPLECRQVDALFCLTLKTSALANNVGHFDGQCLLPPSVTFNLVSSWFDAAVHNSANRQKCLTDKAEHNSPVTASTKAAKVRRGVAKSGGGQGWAWAWSCSGGSPFEWGRAQLAATGLLWTCTGCYGECRRDRLWVGSCLRAL